MKDACMLFFLFRDTSSLPIPLGLLFFVSSLSFFWLEREDKVDDQYGKYWAPASLQKTFPLSVGNCKSV
jgi:hypothetical protein